MNESEITALAREYAKETFKDDESNPDLPICLLNDIKFEAAADFEEKLRFLLRRFCLVEKSLVIAEYQEATAHVEEAIKRKNPCAESCGKGKRLAIQSLFPEIAKEVDNEY